MSKLLQSEYRMKKLVVSTYCLSALTSLSRAESGHVKAGRGVVVQEVEVGLCVEGEADGKLRDDL
jgi:hypothetical protein